MNDAAITEAGHETPTVPEPTITPERAERIRAAFPALRDGLTLLDGPSGTQLPKTVSDMISRALTIPVSNTGGQYASSAQSHEIMDAGREAIADLVGAQADGVAIGPNMTTMTYRMANALSKTWSGSDEIVVSRLDHDANIRPWVQAAVRCGVTVRWADIDPDTCALPTGQYEQLINSRTRLVAVTGASNVAGTRPDVRTIADIAHAAGALMYVDGVHLTAHAPIDMTELGADFYVCSPYKFCGPHLGVVAAAPELLESLDPDRLLPADSKVPAKFEWGTPPFEVIGLRWSTSSPARPALRLPASADGSGCWARCPPWSATKTNSPTRCVPESGHCREPGSTDRRNFALRPSPSRWQASAPRRWQPPWASRRSVSITAITTHWS